MDRDQLITTLKQIDSLLGKCLSELGSGRAGRLPSKAHKAEPGPGAVAISFRMNLLAFMNKYARGLKGPQKFTLLLARLAQGDAARQVPFAEVKKQWNKMKGVMGGEFNPAHANRAKARGWVESPKHGFYTLSDSWKECASRKRLT